PRLPAARGRADRPRYLPSAPDRGGPGALQADQRPPTPVVQAGRRGSSAAIRSLAAPSGAAAVPEHALPGGPAKPAAREERSAGRDQDKRGREWRREETLSGRRAGRIGDRQAKGWMTDEETPGTPLERAVAPGARAPAVGAWADVCLCAR